MGSLYILDETADDSDKSFVVPAERRYVLRYGQVTLISTATAGNRQMALEIQDDAANVVFRSLAGAVQAASVTREYHFTPDVAREAAFVADQIMVPIPPKLVMLPGWTMRFYDVTPVDPAADDMTVAMMLDNSALIQADQVPD